MASIDRGGRTPLHHAALANDAEAVSRLVSEGASPNVPDRLGFTALNFAAQEGAIAVAEILFAAGARVDAANSYGNTPCPRPYSTAADAVTSSGCYAATEPTRGTPNNTGQTPVGTARLIGNYDGTEAHRLLVRCLFAHTTANRIEAATEVDNIAEQKFLEKPDSPGRA